MESLHEGHDTGSQVGIEPSSTLSITSFGWARESTSNKDFQVGSHRNGSLMTR